MDTLFDLTLAEACCILAWNLSWTVELGSFPLVLRAAEPPII
jgi:hypothetical protein